MKKLTLSLFVIAGLIACNSETNKPAENVQTTQEAKKLEHIYKPTYTDNFKIGGEENVMIAEQFHKAGFEKDFETLSTLIADTAVFYNEDGTSLKGKTAIVDYMKNTFSQMTIKNYHIAAIIPVVGENGHQWVDIWDDAEVVTKDGKSQKYQWADAFRFENGKIVMFLGYGKAIKE
ncbi:MAG: SnoaL-like domain [Bacteroidota bacterium]|jgi:ketosteroid isomerase-like protein